MYVCVYKCMCMGVYIFVYIYMYIHIRIYYNINNKCAKYLFFFIFYLIDI